MRCALLVSLVLAGCPADPPRTEPKEPAASTTTTGQAAPAAPAATPAPEPAPPPAGRGTITGRVKLTVPPPERKLLDRSQDPFCARTKAWDESILVGKDGALENVFVRVADVREETPPPAEPALLDQKDCVYRPRVQGVVAGQKLATRNSDATLHNVHTYRGTVTKLNQAQLQGAPPIVKRIKAGEPDRLTVKCDVHPWMIAHVFVSEHPYFMVTGPDGTFSLPRVPAGRHTVEAWHEVYGGQRLEVVVPPDGEVRADFSFPKAPDPPRPGVPGSAPPAPPAPPARP